MADKVLAAQPTGLFPAMESFLFGDFWAQTHHRVWLSGSTEDPMHWEVISDKEKSELDLPNHQLFLKAEIPILWLYLLSHCSRGISQHLHLRQSLGSNTHPDSVRHIEGTFEDESNERRNDCFFQDFSVFGICAPLIQDIFIHSFQNESHILLIFGRGCCSQELKPPFYCCTRSKGIITINNTKGLKGNCFI